MISVESLLDLLTEQEDSERQARQRSSDRLNLGVIFSLGDENARNQRAKDRREPDRARRLAGKNDRQKADREEDLGILRSRSLRKNRGQREAADNEHSADDRDPEKRRSEKAADFLVTCGELDPEEDGDQREVLEQQHSECRLAHRTLDA